MVLVAPCVGTANAGVDEPNGDDDGPPNLNVSEAGGGGGADVDVAGFVAGAVVAVAG